MSNFLLETIKKHGVSEQVALDFIAAYPADVAMLVRGLEYQPNMIIHPPMQDVKWRPSLANLEAFDAWMNELDPCPAFVYETYCNLIDGRNHPIVYLNKARLMAFDAPEHDRKHWATMRDLLEQICQKIGVI